MGLILFWVYWNEHFPFYLFLLGLPVWKLFIRLVMEGFVKVFVYGTLKKGFANHYLMQDGLHGVARFSNKRSDKGSLSTGCWYGCKYSIFSAFKRPGKGTKWNSLMITFWFKSDSNKTTIKGSFQKHPLWKGKL